MGPIRHHNDTNKHSLPNNMYLWERETTRKIHTTYCPEAFVSPILVMWSAMGLFPLCNGVLLMITINQNPLVNTENTGYRNGV